jgi:tetratricopeptide (TPR) repeat protein
MRHILYVCLLASGFSLQAEVKHILEGQLRFSKPSDTSDLRAQLIDRKQRRILAEARIKHEGHFAFNPAPSGLYEVRVVDTSGDILRTVAAKVPSNKPVKVHMDEISNANRRPVSVARLQHTVPKKAFREYVLARDCERNLDRDQSIAHLEKALQLDPQFFEAANNLGVFYLEANRHQEALDLFRLAARIDPSDSTAESNLAYVFLAMGQMKDAEEAARAGLRADAENGRARYFLALSLLSQNKNPQEAEFHLLKAKETFEAAEAFYEQTHPHLP